MYLYIAAIKKMLLCFRFEVDPDTLYGLVFGIENLSREKSVFLVHCALLNNSRVFKLLAIEENLEIPPGS